MKHVSTFTRDKAKKKKREGGWRGDKKKIEAFSHTPYFYTSALTMHYYLYTDNSGLMVQCDKCEVWQHCECIGLIQEKLPDHYYCDQCQPENHQLIKTPNGR